MSDVQVLYGRYATALYRYALALSGNRAEAEDLVADTFARLWAAPGEIRETTVKAYLFTVLRNLFFTRRRRQQREVPLDEQVAGRLSADDRHGDAALELARVHEHLASLSDLDRRALLMRATDGTGYADIATALGLTPGAARVRVHRARAQLAKALGRTPRTS